MKYNVHFELSNITFDMNDDKYIPTIGLKWMLCFLLLQFLYFRFLLWRLFQGGLALIRIITV